MRQLRAGVIGVGAMGRNHVRVLSTLRQAELVGIADASAERATEVAGAYGVPAYTDYRRLLEQVDVVTIATPTVTHCELGLAALDAGVHALIEKPLASSPAEARRLCVRAEEKRLKLQVGHIERFNPAVRELPAILAGARLIALAARRLSPTVRVVDVDVVLDLMIHDLDILCHLVGVEPIYVDAVGTSIRGNGVDHAMAHLTFPGGVVGQLTASRMTAQKVRTLDAVVEGAHVELDYVSREVVIHRETVVGDSWRGNHVSYRQAGVLEKVFVPNAEPLQLEQEAFVACVREDTKSPVSGEEGLRAVELATRVQQQIARNGEARDPA